MVRKKDGSKLTAYEIIDLINSGELLIFAVDADANPKVCDSAEGLAQAATIKRFPDESVIRTIAAGTVARGSYVERDGYGLYGWVLKGAKNNTRFVVGTYSLRPYQRYLLRCRPLSCGCSILEKEPREFTSQRSVVQCTFVRMACQAEKISGSFV